MGESIEWGKERRSRERGEKFPMLYSDSCNKNAMLYLQEMMENEDQNVHQILSMISTFLRFVQQGHLLPYRAILRLETIEGTGSIAAVAVWSNLSHSEQCFE